MIANGIKLNYLKAAYKEHDIHFDAFKEGGKIKNYQIRLTCVQSIELALNLNAKNESNVSDYAKFLAEMDGQIENIETAQMLLQSEQAMLKNSISQGCLREIQNDRKLEIQKALIKLFEQAKSQSNEFNYKSIQSEVYKKAEHMGYQKTQDKQEAVSAYHRRLSWT